MKSFHFLILIALLPARTFSQINFQGTITYKGFSDAGKDSTGLEIMYGKTKMKVSAWNMKENDAREYIDYYRIYDFANGTLTVVRPGEKKASIDSIEATSPDMNVSIQQTAEKKWISSYPAIKYMDTPHETGENSVAFLQTESWFSDEIYYIIPERYRNKRGLHATERGNILYLENKRVYNLGVLLGDTSQKKTTIVTSARKIEPASLNDTLFAVPASCKIVFEKIPDREIKLTEIKISEEGPELEPPPPPPPPLKPLRKTKHPVKTKTSQ
jgi:hypothetical protein